MGLALPLLMRAGTPARRLAGLALASCLPLLLPGRSNATILPFLPVFAAGTLTFLLATNRIGRKSYWAALAVLAGILIKTQRHGRCARDRGHGGCDRHRSHSAGRCHRLARRDLLLALSAACAYRLSPHAYHQAIVRWRGGADPADHRRSGCLDRGSRPASPIRGTAITPARGKDRLSGHASGVAPASIGASASAWRRTDGRRRRRRSSSTRATPSQARGLCAGELPARHPQPPPSPGTLGSAPLTHASPDGHAPSGTASASAQTPSAPEQCPLVHCTSNLHGAPGAAAFAGPHTPSSPETLSSARQRSLAAQVQSQQIPSSQCPLVHSSPRMQEPGPGPASIGPPSCPTSTSTSASAEPASRFSTPSEKR